MAMRDTLNAMFSPARYPAPKLDPFGVAWRYILAVGGYVFFAGGFMVLATTPPDGSVGTDPSTPGAPSITIWNKSGAWPELPWPALALDLALGAAALVLIRYRRRAPFVVALVLQVVGIFSVSSVVTGLWSLLSLASRRNLKQIGIASVVSVACGVASIFLPWHATITPSDTWLPNLITSTVFCALFVLVGLWHGVRQDRVAGVADMIRNVDRDRELAVLSERNRIAREMHDVLAHRISLVSMHAGALAFRDDLPPEKTREVAGIIAENAQASLTELRAVLSTLRDGQLDAFGAPVAPQPTLTEVDGLLSEARSLGQKIGFSSTINASAVPPVISRHAYRILQECLTNARKHAPYAAVTVELSGRPGDRLVLVVSNPLGPRTAGVPGAGMGLIGVRERVAMLGGQVTIDDGSQSDAPAHFTVTCRLPWPAPEERS